MTTTDERAAIDDEIVRAYQGSESTKSITQRLGISYNRMYRAVDAAGIARRGLSQPRPEATDEQPIEERVEAVGPTRSERTLAQIERQYSELPEATRERIRDLRTGRHTDHAWGYDELMREFGLVAAVVHRVLATAEPAAAEVYDPEPPLEVTEKEVREPSAEALEEMPEVTPEQMAGARRGRYAEQITQEQQARITDLDHRLQVQLDRVLDRVAEMQEQLALKQDTIEHLEHRLAELQNAQPVSPPAGGLPWDQPVATRAVDLSGVTKGQYKYRGTVLQYTVAEREISLAADSFAEAMSRVADQNVVEIVRLERADYEYHP